MIHQKKNFMLRDLRHSLERTRGLSRERLAAEIKDIGFKCISCGECCSGEDNSVVVFPFEVRQILKATRESWTDEVEPPNEGEWDLEGQFHTLEWRLKKTDGSCKFFISGKCKIYDDRPLLCRTYPFYLDEGNLHYSECQGLRERIDYEKAMDMADLLINRSITEIEEAIGLIERYTDFKRGMPKTKGHYIVHDSEGQHKISKSED